MNASFRFREKMLRNFLHITIALSIVSVLIAAAQTSKSRKPGVRRPCTLPMTQPEENACSFDQYQEADQRLKVLLRKIRQPLEEDLASYKDADDERREWTQVAIQKLNAAQDAWINYQKQHCDAVAHEYEHGTFQPTAWALCMKQTIEHRIEDLRQAYEIQ